MKNLPSFGHLKLTKSLSRLNSSLECSMIRKFALLLFTFFATLPIAWGQNGSGADFMESIGKMYVVVAVIVVIFLGLIIYLVRIDRKVSKLENQIKDND
jgi:CcmD family protein